MTELDSWILSNNECYQFKDFESKWIKKWHERTRRLLSRHGKDIPGRRNSVSQGLGVWTHIVCNWVTKTELQKPQDGWSCHKTSKELDNGWEAFGAKSFHEAHLVGFTEVDETGKKVFENKAFPRGSVVKNPPKRQEMQLDAGSIPGSERSRRRAWPPTPVFLHGESQGQRSLAVYSPWSREELYTTEMI